MYSLAPVDAFLMRTRHPDQTQRLNGSAQATKRVMMLQGGERGGRIYHISHSQSAESTAMHHARAAAPAPAPRLPLSPGALVVKNFTQIRRFFTLIDFSSSSFSRDAG
jgi:hypothetical protein